MNIFFRNLSVLIMYRYYQEFFLKAFNCVMFYVRQEDESLPKVWILDLVGDVFHIFNEIWICMLRNMNMYVWLKALGSIVLRFLASPISQEDYGTSVWCCCLILFKSYKKINRFKFNLILLVFSRCLKIVRLVDFLTV